MDPSALILGGGQAVEGLPAAIVSIRSLLRGRGTSGGTGVGNRALEAIATDAYLEFAGAGSDILVQLHLIANVGSPGLVGAAWTWPPVFRAYRELFAAVPRLVKATTHMVVAGSEDVNDAAYEFSETLEPLTQRIVARGGKLRKAEDFDELHHRSSETLRGFLLAVRAEIASCAADRDV